MWRLKGERNQYEFWTGLKMTKMIMGLFDRAAQWTAFGASEPSSWSDMRKVAQWAQWQFWPSSHSGIDVLQVAILTIFALFKSTLPYCPDYGGDDETWDTSIKNVGREKESHYIHGWTETRCRLHLGSVSLGMGTQVTQQTWHCWD